MTINKVFPYDTGLCYITGVLRDKQLRKKVIIMKKLSELLKEYYESYREGRG